MGPQYRVPRTVVVGGDAAIAVRVSIGEGVLRRELHSAFDRPPLVEIGLEVGVRPSAVAARIFASWGT